MEAKLLNTKENGIYHITLTRSAQLNALNHSLLCQLDAAFTEAGQDSAIKAILISGEGKAFCAGADMSEQLAILNGITGAAFAEAGQAVFRKLELSSKPSIAAIHDYAFGGGLELAMSATIRIAEAGTQFSQPEIKLGIIPGFGGTQRLARLIGKGRALEICLTGKRFSADDALNWGLITEKTEKAKLIDRAFSLLQTLTSLPAIAMTSVMKTIQYGYDLSLADALAFEAQLFALCCSTEDKNEGVRAFLAKQHPKFVGA